MRSSHSPTIRSRYDYYYSSMSPASSAANFYDNQNQSLFGDPVPPSTDFLETLDNHLYGSLRRNSLLPNAESDVFMDEFMAVQSRAHQLRMASARQKEIPLPPTPIRDDFHNGLKQRSSSTFSDEIRANLDAFKSDSDVLIPTAPKRLFSDEPINFRNISIHSNDSHKFSGDSQTSSSEWVRPNTDNWKGFPRPASRNIMHIDHGSAMLAILPDSTASSSDENKSSLYGNAKTIQVLPYRKNSTSATTVSSSTRLATNESSSEEYSGSISATNRDLSPAIFTETINTGSEFRFQPSRQHKKTSFTIINELSPNQSRPPSPTGGRSSPFRGKGFRANSSMRSMRPVSCPESPRDSMNLDNTSSHDDSLIHKPTVHFNVIPPVPRKRTAIKVLQSTLDMDTEYVQSIADASYHDRDMESFEMLSNDQIRSASSSRRGSIRAIYPELPRMMTKPSPAPRRHLHNSTGNLNESSPETDIILSTPLINPRSYHKGLLRVVSSAQISPSKIPRRKNSLSGANSASNLSTSRKNSLVSSMDHLNRARDSFVSPKRKKSIDLGGSMIDLGVTSNSMTPSRSNSRISKPTTLSPIIGTPNKDCQQKERQCEDTSSKCSADQSPTKIPMRRNSSVNVNSQLSSRSNSKVGSRESSPPKNVVNKSPTKIPQKINQKVSPTKTMAKTKKSATEIEKHGTIRKDTGAAGGQTNPNKESSSVKKESAINREKSSVKKVPTAAVKREPSTLKRQPSNLLKREPSNLKRTPSNLKRENSNLGKKLTTTRPEQSILQKNQSDSSLAKRLEKKNSFKLKRRTSSESDGLNEMKDTANTSDKLIPLTKPNVVSMTTAAIASQPVQITTAVTNQLNKTNSTGQIVNNDNLNSDNNINNNNVNSSNVNNDSVIVGDARDMHTSSPANNLGKAEKNLDTMQKTVAGANEVIQKTIENNVNDSKTSEKGLMMADDNVSGGPAVMASLQKKSSTRTLGGKSDIVNISDMSMVNDMSQSVTDTENISSAIETNVNIIEGGLNNNSGSDNNNDTILRSSNNTDERQNERSIAMGADVELESSNLINPMDNLGQDNNGIGTHIDPSTGVKNKMSENAEGESDEQTTCCKLCKCCTPCYASALCLPCRRLKNLSCCKRGEKLAEHNKAAVAQILHETETKADSCWKRMKWCNRNNKKKIMEEVTSIEQQAVTATQTIANTAKETIDKQHSKCSMCLAKFLCCRKTNKIQSTTDAEDEVRKCCFCIPCRTKPKEAMAWTDNRQDSVMSDIPKKSCCANLCERLMCCKKKEIVESRRTSMNSKKQSIAPTLPPEDTRPKIDESLVDHTSLMKAAIPVLPVCLAWFCLICNCLVPGFGTICSGIFCLCLGIPRFSQHDSVRARIGSFVINTFVGVAQAFTLIFCLVGWGWSIWWGMIMLRASKKHRKLMQTDDADLEEAQTIASHSTSNPPVLTQNHRDVEAGRTI